MWVARLLQLGLWFLKWLMLQIATVNIIVIVINCRKRGFALLGQIRIQIFAKKFQKEYKCQLLYTSFAFCYMVFVVVVSA